MYNSLENLPKRVVLDSNVCLNAVFIPSSVAYKVVELLRALDFAPFLSEQIVNECEVQLGLVTPNTEKSFFLIKCFRSWIQQKKLLIVPVADLASDELVKINKRDRSVVKAMLENKAWLLTNDAPLFLEVKSIGGEPRFPWDVAIESELRKTGEWPLWAVIRLHPMRQREGSIFVRFYTLWGSDQVRGKTPYLVDIDRLISVFYDGNTGCIVARHEQGVEVSMPVKIFAGDMQTILVNYSRPGRLQLRATGSTEPVQIDLGNINGIAFSQPVGQPFFGSDRHGKNQINGQLRSLVTHPKVISGDRWRTYLSIPNASPNPWDELSLGEFLRGQ